MKNCLKFESFLQKRHLEEYGCKWCEKENEYIVNPQRTFYHHNHFHYNIVIVDIKIFCVCARYIKKLLITFEDYIGC